MSALPLDYHDTPVQLPNTVGAIRASLPAELRPKLQAELDAAIDAAIDQSDTAAIDQVLGRWWARAAWESDPTIRESFQAAGRGELEFLASPFARR